MNQQIKAYLISYGRLFVAAAIACYLTLGVQPLEIGAEDWKAIANAAIAALILSVFNALNPKDQRYGVGAPTARQLSAGDVATNTDAGLIQGGWLGTLVLVLLAICALIFIIGHVNLH